MTPEELSEANRAAAKARWAKTSKRKRKAEGKRLAEARARKAKS